MKLPLQIVFRNMGPSEAIEAKVHERAQKLDRFYEHIMSCRVVIEESHKHHERGNLYHVRIDMKVPDAEIVANREPDAHHGYTDVYVAIRDAFDSARRQLQDYARERRQEVKSHEIPPHGHVVSLVPEENFGRIGTADGREVYFHRNSVIDASFDELKVGDEVRFAEEEGELGPQASTVRVVGKHHLAP